MAFHVDHEGGIVRDISGVVAAGSGGETARGAALAALELGACPELAVSVALRASERCCSQVRAPFTVLTTSPTE